MVPPPLSHRALDRSSHHPFAHSHSSRREYGVSTSRQVKDKKSPPSCSLLSFFFVFQMVAYASVVLKKK